MRVLGTEDFFPDRQCAFIKREGLSVVTHSLVEVRQIDKGCCGMRVLGTEGFFQDRQGAFIKREGLGVVSHGLVETGQIVQG